VSGCQAHLSKILAVQSSEKFSWFRDASASNVFAAKWSWGRAYPWIDSWCGCGWFSAVGGKQRRSVVTSGWRTLERQGVWALVWSLKFSARAQRWPQGLVRFTCRRWFEIGYFGFQITSYKHARWVDPVLARLIRRDGYLGRHCEYCTRRMKS
jgi:hypothetical protein